MRFTSAFLSTAICVTLLASAEARPYPSPVVDLAPRQTVPGDGCGQPSGRSCN
ncbi:hypothetical protein M422DRAFT_266821 [Sphaerobolus stellatus SS14]|uniref:Uncharacterized protein n=1 Tax=Sphaerobolus stellatus (strain SS14) TaxID=990650 RepID=A0A0C9V1W4_SPHS4|nr:hypothetical protein M422DRAFT_266821 [Sphaerobolus stellatus SS14]